MHRRSPWWIWRRVRKKDVAERNSVGVVKHLKARCESEGDSEKKVKVRVKVKVRGKRGKANIL